MKVSTLVKITLGVSIGLMLLALNQEAYCTAEGCMHSMMAFIFGIFGMFIGGNETLAWFANPLLISAWLFIKHRKASFEPPRLYRRVIYLSQAAMPDRVKLS